MSTIFNFPNQGIDQFDPPLVNDFTIVNADHVLDLRYAVEQIEQALVGITPLNYQGTSIIQTGDNLVIAIQKLDTFISNIANLLGYNVSQGLTRLNSLELQFNAHRAASGYPDSEGYGVHGVDGYVVGTLNQQILENKVIDTGTWNVGPKITIRSSLADAGLRQFELYGSDNGLKAWIDEQGSARFKNLTIDGYTVLAGVDLVKNSLLVDGYTILGNDKSTDYLQVNGNTTIDGSLNITDSNQTFGDSTGTLNLNYTRSNLSGDAYVSGGLNVAGSTTFGDLAGSDVFTFKGNILQQYGSLYTAGDFTAGGSRFQVNSNQTSINTITTSINSSTLNIGSNISIDGVSGNMNSTGSQFQFGSILIQDDICSIDGFLIVNKDINVSSGSKLNTPLVEANQVVTNTIQLSTGASIGSVWRAVDSQGNGQWSDLSNIINWSTVVTDGYQQADIDSFPNYTPLTPTGSFLANPKQEIFASAVTFSTLTPSLFNIYLPTNPPLGCKIRVIDHGSTWNSLNPLYVFPGSSTINGSASYSLTQAGGWVEFTFNGNQWRTLS